ncbi:MAG: murC [Candidatus Saccharibacteria bacterium]|nr:murC [Candidatus Saccharibacteria bacterium]
MHIYFSGIGGTAIGPLALIAKQAGYEVSGSDKQDSQYVQYLRQHSINNIHIGQTREQIAALHDIRPIDWLVYSSALPLENPNHEELVFAHDQDIKTSKRDELLNQILSDKKLKLLAIAGTHGKTTTTAMVVWLFKQLGQPISYSVGAKISYGEMGQYQEDSEYFVYECDEFDRNFLAFTPHLSLISGVSWDHHEIFPTREDYQEAFKEFIKQSSSAILWQDDLDYLHLPEDSRVTTLDPSEHEIEKLALFGLYNRLDAWLAIQGVHKLTGEPVDDLAAHMNLFPGLQRRMEEIVPGLYTDYAHTPEKIRGAMSVALEMAARQQKNVVVVYEPLTNRRQHHMMNDYQDCLAGAAKVYWLPSYLAREDPADRIIPPEELISHLSDPTIAEPRERNEALLQLIHQHLDKGDMVVAIAGGGGDSLDEWIRNHFSSKKDNH